MNTVFSFSGFSIFSLPYSHLSPYHTVFFADRPVEKSQRTYTVTVHDGDGNPVTVYWPSSYGCTYAVYGTVCSPRHQEKYPGHIVDKKRAEKIVVLYQGYDRWSLSHTQCIPTVSGNVNRKLGAVVLG